MEFIRDNFLRLSHTMIRSEYYKRLLTPVDRCVLNILWDNILNPSTYYSMGILAANIRQETLVEKAGEGVSYATLRRTLDKLDDLGVIVKIHNRFKNIRYFLGLKGSGNDYHLLIYHLIELYENTIINVVDQQIHTYGKIIGITDSIPYRLNPTTREFIINNFDSNNLTKLTVKDNKTLHEILFNVPDPKKQIVFKPNVVAIDRSI